LSYLVHFAEAATGDKLDVADERHASTNPLITRFLRFEVLPARRHCWLGTE